MARGLDEAPRSGAISMDWKSYKFRICAINWRRQIPPAFTTKQAMAFWAGERATDEYAFSTSFQLERDGRGRCVAIRWRLLEMSFSELMSTIFLILNGKVNGVIFVRFISPA
jgi:hypothetical protein